MEYAVLLKNISKRFSTHHNHRETLLAVDSVSLALREGEFMAMVGPRGCGKSTILRLIAGLEQPTAGEIYVGGRRVDGVPARARNVGFTFQGHALFKNMTVDDNISFGLKIKKVSKKDRRRRVEELVALMSLEGLEGLKPYQLSREQQQRVALARALAPQPRILLLDEPFGALDPMVRQQLRADTKRWQRQLQIPTILVTHDHSEALELGDRVAILNAGRFEQIDTSPNIYNNPANPFVANFIGRSEVSGTMLEDDRSRLVHNGQIEVLGRPRTFSIQPWRKEEQLEEDEPTGTIASNAFLGRTVRLEVQLSNGRPVTVALHKNQAVANNLNPGRSIAISNGSFPVLPSVEVAGNAHDNPNQEVSQAGRAEH